jgi:hypothetical protein
LFVWPGRGLWALTGRWVAGHRPSMRGRGGSSKRLPVAWARSS